MNYLLFFWVKIRHKKIMRFYLHFLIIFAIFSAGISPACAFMNGSVSIMEICSSNGISIQQDVPEELLPFISGFDENEKERVSYETQCSFCLHFSDIKAPLQTSEYVYISDNAGYIQISAGLRQPRSLEFINFQSRAPPIFS